MRYAKISAEVAMGVADSQIFQEKPKVYMSLSDLMPGYLKKSQVPPRLARLSRMTYLAHLQLFDHSVLLH